AVQRRDERDIAPRHRLEIGVAIEREWQPFRASGLPAFGRPAQVEAGAEIIAMAEDDAALRLLARALDGRAQCLHHRRIEAIAFVRTIEADQRDLAVQLVGDHLFFAHALLLIRLAHPTGVSAAESGHTLLGLVRLLS